MSLLSLLSLLSLRSLFLAFCYDALEHSGTGTRHKESYSFMRRFEITPAA